jgi:uncharacterized protein (DUF4213/DUF364 family)
MKMMQKGEILKRIYDTVFEESDRFPIQDVRIGIGYVGVRVWDDRLGLAALLLNELPPECSRFAEAGTLMNAPASELVRYLVDGTNPLEKALGLATANALLRPDVNEKKEEDAIVLMKLTPEDRVAMVGLFPPLVSRIEATGATLSVLERNPARMAPTGEKERRAILASCTVAVITATSLLNDTLEDVLGALGNPRHVAILGPSTPLCMEVFSGTPVTHLGGAVAPYTRRVLQILSEGGGTPQMRPHLWFVNLLKEKET